MSFDTQGIANRLSLRQPQRDSLDILAEICELIPLQKDQDLPRALACIRERYPSVSEFERDFPSLCFALATGVGKTRLMGAFIAYLYRAKRIRHYFVLAPNLTIYQKLIQDFTPNTPKYVFQGLSEFASTPPEVITGDNYESGRGVRAERGWQTGFAFDPSQPVHVNIFNISKINTEVRGGNAPRIKRLAEYIGTSYFEYLAELDDLVLLMDESHRYRASAGVRAINELKPILGLELTATPQIEGPGTAQPFKNVIYSYPLSEAMKDGFVKEPAVATRENFDATRIEAAELERIKLEDGIRLHEFAKSELLVYANENGKPRVKPFLLVVAQDTEHAGALRSLLESDSFYDGAYRGKVIEVHSAQSGQEKDDNVARLLAVEDPQSPVEIVVHVNMLKEGWDVTNLYTIVPLRAANSRTLVEQSIGRGLRLPFGRRTGVAAVDRLSIVSHDHFQEIVDEARNPSSIIRTGIVIGRDVPLGRTHVVEVAPLLVRPSPEPVAGTSAEKRQEVLPLTPSQIERRRQIDEKTLEVIHRGFGSLPNPAKLRSPEVLIAIARTVAEELAPVQTTIEGVASPEEIVDDVEDAILRFEEIQIAIPRIVVVPTDTQSGRFLPFRLDLGSFRPQPVEQQILLQYLRTEEKARLSRGEAIADESRLEDYVVRGLVDFDDICYDDHSELLYDLASQVVAHLRTYLPDEEAQRDVLRYYQRHLANEVHEQMLAHYESGSTEYEVQVTRGFVELPKASISSSEAAPRDFRQPLEDKSRIRQLTFTGFLKSVYAQEKFDSDPERRFAVLLESDPKVLKWLRPRRGVIRIYYRQEEEYVPDFVAETADAKYLCEIKGESSLDDPEVEDKATAAVLWCERASQHAAANGDKPWSYLIVPAQVISENRTLEGLAAEFRRIPAPHPSVG